MAKIDYYKFSNERGSCSLFLEVSKYKTLEDAENHAQKRAINEQYIFKGIVSREELRRFEPRDQKRVIPRG